MTIRRSPSGDFIGFGVQGVNEVSEPGPGAWVGAAWTSVLNVELTTFSEAALIDALATLLVETDAAGTFECRFTVVTGANTEQGEIATRVFLAAAAAGQAWAWQDVISIPAGTTASFLHLQLRRTAGAGQIRLVAGSKIVGFGLV